MVDLKAALDFVTRLGDVSRFDDVGRVALAGLAELVPADLWAFNDLDEVKHDMVSVVWPPTGARPEDFRAVAEVVWEHPALAYFEKTGRGGPIRLSDLWDRARYRSSALYRDAYRSMGVEYQVMFTVADGAMIAPVGFAANRSQDDFSDDEVSLLTMLRPPLRTMWERIHAHGAVVAALENLPRATDALLVVDSHGRMRAATNSARTCLEAAGVDVRDAEAVGEPVLSWLRRNGRGEELTFTARGERVTVEHLAGARGADRVLAIHHEGAALAALTPREREIVELIARGSTNAEIGRRLAISPRTVQKHLENAYAKLGVTNRTAAAAAIRRA